VSTLKYKIYKIVDHGFVTYYLKISEEVFVKVCCNCPDCALKKDNHSGVVHTGTGGRIIAGLIKISGYEASTLDVLVTTGLTESDLQSIFEKAYESWQEKF